MFSWARGSPCYKQNSAKILIEFQVLAHFLKIRIHDKLGWVGFSFFKWVRIPDALRAFSWIPRNWDPFKGTRRLPYVGLCGSGRDNFIGIRANDFQISHVNF